MSKTKQPRNRLETLSQDEKMLAGVNQFLSALPSLTVGSQTMTPAQITQMIQGRIASAEAAETAHTDHIAAAKADRDQRSQTSRPMAALKRIVEGMFMESPDKLAVFGLSAPKAPEMTTAARAAAAAKGVKTRKANHPTAAAASSAAATKPTA